MRIRKLGAVFAVVMLVASAHATANEVRAAYNAPCDNLETNNVFVARDQSINPSVDPLISWVSGAIWYYNPRLCSFSGGLAPTQSSSGAWVAIEGPFLSGSLGGNSIVQVGYIKCQSSTGCNASGIPSSHYNRVVYFYAFGNANDVFHMPEPQFIADAPTSSIGHTFKVNLHYSSGTSDWQFIVDGSVRASIGDSWRTWSRVKAQVANELWNEGDQLGGDPSVVQSFRSVAWYNGITHTGLSGSVYRSGHCYPWSQWKTWGSNSWDTWTTNSHTNC
jgi:hypothetical protein